MNMFPSKISGIPCQVLVNTLHIEPQTFDCPGSCDFDYEIYDRKGYRARWLESKVTGDDHNRLIDEYIHWMSD